MKKHIRHDAGHGGHDSGATGNGHYEKDLTLLLALKVGALMEKAGYKSSYTRTTDTFVSLNNISASANRSGANYFVSYHWNAFNKSACGTELFTYKGERYNIAVKVNEALANKGWVNRGIKNGSHLAVINGTTMTALLVEVCFIDSKHDMDIFAKCGIDNLAIDIAKALDTAISGKSSNIGGNIPDVIGGGSTTDDGKLKDVYILNIEYPKVSVAQMQQWAKNNKANQTFIDLAQTFYDEGMKAHVNPAVLYAQSAKETNFMNFGGIIDISYNNVCGMKVTNPTGDSDKNPNMHYRFSSWKEGIQAFAHHMALYAGHTRFPRYSPHVPATKKFKTNGTTSDPRHFAWIYGKAKNVKDLNGLYATPSAQSVPYGDSVLDYINRMIAVPYVDLPPVENNNEVPVEDVHWAYDYVVELNKMIHEHNIENPNDQIKGISELRFDDDAKRSEMFRMVTDSIRLATAKNKK